MGRDADYFRRMAKRNYEANKKIKEMWSVDSNPGETFSKYKQRKYKNPLS